MAEQSLKLFISHSSEDDDFIDKLIKILKPKMPFIEPVLAARQKTLTEAFGDKVMKLINKSDAVLVLFTESGIRNQWVNQEVGFAVALHKPIVTVVERKFDSKGKGTPIETQGFITAQHDSASYEPRDENKSIEEIITYVKKAYNEIKATTAEALEIQAASLKSRELYWEAYQKLNEAAKIYLEKKDFAKAIRSVKKGIENLQTGDEWLWEVAQSNVRLGRILNESGAEAYQIIGAYENAANAFLQGDIQYPYEAGEILEKAANVALKSSNHDKAYDLFMRVADAFEKSGTPSRPAAARKQADAMKKKSSSPSRRPKSK